MFERPQQLGTHPDGIGAPAPYISYICALGIHDECREANTPPVPAGLPLIYERCTCKCHPDTEKKRAEEAAEGEGR